jgi:hypothetical protein
VTSPYAPSSLGLAIHHSFGNHKQGDGKNASIVECFTRFMLCVLCFRVFACSLTAMAGALLGMLNIDLLLPLLLGYLVTWDPVDTLRFMIILA